MNVLKKDWLFCNFSAKCDFAYYVDETPFQKTGYTKDTKFKLLQDYGRLKKGDIVTLDYDDGSDCPWFITDDGIVHCIHLQDMVSKSCRKVLEVYEEGK